MWPFAANKATKRSLCGRFGRISETLLVAYSAFVLPLNLAFQTVQPWGEEAHAFIFDTICDVIFLIDIYLNFRTGYYEARGPRRLRFWRVQGVRKRPQNCEYNAFSISNRTERLREVRFWP